MSKQMPDLIGRLVKQVQLSLDIVSSTETLWLTAPPASDIRKRLKVDQREALYESAYLRIFTSWESFQEETVSRLLAGYRTSTYQPAASQGRSLFATVVQARTALYEGRDYILWHNSIASANRCAKWLHSSPVETVLRANSPTLQNYAAIRHNIAHSSSDARQKFEIAATALSGNPTPGSPGKLLRSADISDPLNQPKWIRKIAYDLIDIGRTMIT